MKPNPYGFLMLQFEKIKEEFLCVRLSTRMHGPPDSMLGMQFQQFAKICSMFARKEITTSLIARLFCTFVLWKEFIYWDDPNKGLCGRHTPQWAWSVSKTLALVHTTFDAKKRFPCIVWHDSPAHYEPGQYWKIEPRENPNEDSQKMALELESRFERFFSDRIEINAFVHVPVRIVQKKGETKEVATCVPVEIQCADARLIVFVLCEPFYSAKS